MNRASALPSHGIYAGWLADLRSHVAPIRLAAVLMCIGAAGCGGGNGASSPIPQPSSIAGGASIDAIVNKNYTGGWGVEVAIYRNGRAVYTRGYGLRDRGLPDTFDTSNFWGLEQPEQLFNVPRGAFAPDTNTYYDLASVSKEFTAAAILLLQQDGKLSVSDPLSKYFPTFPSGNQISLQNLLWHTSGLVDYVNFGSSPDFTTAYQAFLAGGQTDYGLIIDRLGSFPLLFGPGTAWNYSNSDYLLLGQIVAKVSGETLGAFLQQRIFGPLGMSQTQQGYPSAPVTDLALGYHQDGTTIYRAWQWSLPYAAGAGGLTSTVGDIEKWDRAVRQPGIFTQASRGAMFAPCAFPQSFGTYADGWIVSALNGHRFIWHDGAIGGFQTVNATFPDDGLDIVILTNDGSGTDPYFLIPQIFPIALSLS